MRLDELRMRRRFTSWEVLASLLNSNIAKSSAFIPIFGYLILFNDEILQYVNFDIITGGNSLLFLDSKTRLQSIYFGLIIFSASMIWLKLRCPREIALTPEKDQFVRTLIEDWGINDFTRLYIHLEEKYGFGKFDDVPFSRGDLYKLIEIASDLKIFPETLHDDELYWGMSDLSQTQHGKEMSKEFLLFLLRAKFDYLRFDRPTEVHLLLTSFCIAFVLLAVPSLDVFVSVVSDILLQSGTTNT